MANLERKIPRSVLDRGRIIDSLLEDLTLVDEKTYFGFNVNQTILDVWPERFPGEKLVEVQQTPIFDSFAVQFQVRTYTENGKHKIMRQFNISDCRLKKMDVITLRRFIMSDKFDFIYNIRELAPDEVIPDTMSYIPELFAGKLMNKYYGPTLMNPSGLKTTITTDNVDVHHLKPEFEDGKSEPFLLKKARQRAEKHDRDYRAAHHVEPKRKDRYDRKVDRTPVNKDYKPSLLKRIFGVKSRRNANHHYNKDAG